MDAIITSYNNFKDFVTQATNWAVALRDDAMTAAGPVTLEDILQARIAPAPEMFDPERFLPNATIDTAARRMNDAFPALTAMWTAQRAVRNMAEATHATAPAAPAIDPNIVRTLQQALTKPEDKIREFDGAVKRSVLEFYSECENYFQVDLMRKLDTDSQRNEMHTFLKGKIKAGSIHRTFERSWNEWREAEKAKGVADPWPTKDQIIAWLESTIVVKRSPMDLYTRYQNLKQKGAGLTGYNGYKLQHDQLVLQMKENGISVQVAGNEQAAILHFINGLHKTVRDILGHINQPTWAQNKTLAEAQKDITERALLKLQKDGSQQEQDDTYRYRQNNRTYNRPRVAWAGEEEWYGQEEYEQETWPEEQVAWTSEYDDSYGLDTIPEEPEWNEYEEENTEFDQDYTEEDTVAYVKGFKGGSKGNKGGFKGSYKGSYKGGKGYKGYQSYTGTYGGKGNAKGGKSGKGYKGGKSSAYHPYRKEVTEQRERCKKCKSTQHSELEACWYSEQYNAAKHGERPSWVDPKDQEQLARICERNMARQDTA